jgi:rhamnosyltransferase
MKPEVSIIIRTKNEGAHIGRTLERVFEQRHKRFEVIVVDSGSTDDTLKIVRKFPVKLIQLLPEQFTYGRALNVGIEKAQGEFFVSLSAHALPFDREWLSNILLPFVDQEVAGVAVRVLPHLDCNPFDRRGLRRRFGERSQYLHYDSKITFSNACSAARRSVWAERAFDEGLPYSEDIDWSRRMMQKGRRFVYEPTAKVFHSHNETATQLFDRFYNEASARALLDPGAKRFLFFRLLFDMTAGTAYDFITALFVKKALRWMAFAPRRRLSINLGRYLGSRQMKKNSKWNPLTRVIFRALAFVWLLFAESIDRLIPHIVALTNKEAGRAHPNQLIDDSPDVFWFEPYFEKTQMALVLGVSATDSLLRVAGLSENVFGIDNNSRRLLVAKILASWESYKNVTLVASQSDKIPFKDEAFDRVFISSDKGLPENLPAFLLEVAKTVAPNGRLLVTVPKSDTPWAKSLRALGLCDLAKRNSQKAYTENEMKTLMSKNGFALEATLPTVSDTAWFPIINLVGAFSLTFYKKLYDRQKRIAQNHPETSREMRMVFTKQEHDITKRNEPASE